jgi:hypothetical protein
LCQWQDEQFDEPQLEQPEPPPVEEALNLYPTEKPKLDIFFEGFAAPHAGHRGSSSLNTISSNSFPHFSQTYSYIGMPMAS